MVFPLSPHQGVIAILIDYIIDQSHLWFKKQRRSGQKHEYKIKLYVLFWLPGMTLCVWSNPNRSKFEYCSAVFAANFDELFESRPSRNYSVPLIMERHIHMFDVIIDFRVCRLLICMGRSQRLSCKHSGRMVKIHDLNWSYTNMRSRLLMILKCNLVLTFMCFTVPGVCKMPTTYILVSCGTKSNMNVMDLYIVDCHISLFCDICNPI